jgi:tRNA threonylcarbamoyladenosine biosynthesis protein TsaB
MRKMPSLSQIMKGSVPLLVLDAASERVQVGVLRGNQPPRWASEKAEAGTGLFACLDTLGADVNEAAGFAFCEGPGSILGIRTVAAAIRTWNAIRPRPTFGYYSLAVAAEALGRDGASLIADARRGRWHRLRRGGPLERVEPAGLGGELATPEGFRHWDPLPEGTSTVSYDLSRLLSLPRVLEADLFRDAPRPDAFLHQEPDYAKWTPQIHRAP